MVRTLLVAVCLFVAAAGATVYALNLFAASAPAALRITALHGSFSAGSVHLRATLCIPSGKATYPEEIDVDHYSVSKSGWWLARAVRDRAPYLVPFQEGWRGRECGVALVEDPLPATHYGVESVGNTLGCYGVRLTIVADHSRASRRAIVSCLHDNP